MNNPNFDYQYRKLEDRLHKEREWVRELEELLIRAREYVWHDARRSEKAEGRLSAVPELLLMKIDDALAKLDAQEKGDVE